MAMKCGNCQKKRIANSTQPPNESEPRAAAQPISGGSAPGIAPTAVESVVRVFSGVYNPRYKIDVATAISAESQFTASNSQTAPIAIDEMPKINTSRGYSVPEGSGRAAVRRITESISRSTY